MTLGLINSSTAPRACRCLPVAADEPAVVDIPKEAFERDEYCRLLHDSNSPFVDCLEKIGVKRADGFRENCGYVHLL